MIDQRLIDFLDEKVTLYNRPDFIAEDPICIPHAFQKQQDIEIAGLFAATLAWGLRKTIINKCRELLAMMDNTPHDFVLNHSEDDLKPLLNFKHRTFNATDTLYFIAFLKHHYLRHESLETAFISPTGNTTKDALTHYHDYFFSLDFAPDRTKKHVSTPQRKSACKRINMFLRWMVRQDNLGVDFGIWNTLQPSQLICPLDVHVQRTALKLNLLSRTQSDWQAAEQLTQQLRLMDLKDPVKYDFALFGLGVIEKF
ncbi:TIGR02757 family protein [Reichenbachiella agariperforans]|uniref:TIGR02757 family protein n=1 Tax=Reichenbachiella agariperforans TaxID=156994 RepID=UPI001C097F30|nr:TIGR02757 family protein [Reichenbachiella agariperforans]MBU2916228.1 TIGR02757 family protein [Reichenbachiella agariperforans]